MYQQQTGVTLPPVGPGATRPFAFPPPMPPAFLHPAPFQSPTAVTGPFGMFLPEADEEKTGQVPHPPPASSTSTRRKKPLASTLGSDLFQLDSAWSAVPKPAREYQPLSLEEEVQVQRHYKAIAPAPGAKGKHAAQSVSQYGTPLERERERLRKALKRYHRMQERQQAERKASRPHTAGQPGQSSKRIIDAFSDMSLSQPASRPATHHSGSRSAKTTRPHTAFQIHQTSPPRTARPGTAGVVGVVSPRQVASPRPTTAFIPSSAQHPPKRDVPFWLPLTKREGSTLMDEVLDSGSEILHRADVGGNDLSIQIHKQVEKQAARTRIPEEELIRAREQQEDSMRAAEPRARKPQLSLFHPPQPYTAPNATHPSAYVPYLGSELRKEEREIELRARKQEGQDGEQQTLEQQQQHQPQPPPLHHYYDSSGLLHSSPTPPSLVPPSALAYAGLDPSLPNLLGWVMSLHPERTALRSAADRWREAQARSWRHRRSREREKSPGKGGWRRSKETPRTRKGNEDQEEQEDQEDQQVGEDESKQSSSVPNASDASLHHARRPTASSLSSAAESEKESSSLSGTPPFASKQQHRKAQSSISVSSSPPPLHPTPSPPATTYPHLSQEAFFSSPSNTRSATYAAPLPVASTSASGIAADPRLPSWKVEVLREEQRQRDQLAAQKEWARRQQEEDDAEERGKEQAAAAAAAVAVAQPTPQTQAQAQQPPFRPTPPVHPNPSPPPASASPPQKDLDFLLLDDDLSPAASSSLPGRLKRERLLKEQQSRDPRSLTLYPLRGGGEDPDSLLGLIPTTEVPFDHLSFPDPYRITKLDPETAAKYQPRPNWKELGSEDTRGGKGKEERRLAAQQQEWIDNPFGSYHDVPEEIKQYLTGELFQTTKPERGAEDKSATGGEKKKKKRASRGASASKENSPVLSIRHVIGGDSSTSASPAQVSPLDDDPLLSSIAIPASILDPEPVPSRRRSSASASKRSSVTFAAQQPLPPSAMASPTAAGAASGGGQQQQFSFPTASNVSAAPITSASTSPSSLTPPSSSRSIRPKSAQSSSGVAPSSARRRPKTAASSRGGKAGGSHGSLPDPTEPHQPAHASASPQQPTTAMPSKQQQSVSTPNTPLQRAEARVIANGGEAQTMNEQASSLLASAVPIPTMNMQLFSLLTNPANSLLSPGFKSSLMPSALWFDHIQNECRSADMSEASILRLIGTLPERGLSNEVEVLSAVQRGLAAARASPVRKVSAESARVSHASRPSSRVSHASASPVLLATRELEQIHVESQSLDSTSSLPIPAPRPSAESIADPAARDFLTPVSSAQYFGPPLESVAGVAVSPSLNLVVPSDAVAPDSAHHLVSSEGPHSTPTASASPSNLPFASNPIASLQQSAAGTTVVTLELPPPTAANEQFELNAAGAEGADSAAPSEFHSPLPMHRLTVRTSASDASESHLKVLDS